VETCLNIVEDDRVLIFTDEDTLTIGRSLQEAAAEIGAEVELKTLEEIGPRPLKAVPQSLWDFLADYQPTASFYAAGGQKGEIHFRIPLIETMRETYRIRHGHMIGITSLLMRTGMQADYLEVNRRTEEIAGLVKDAREVVIKSSAGTDFTTRLDPEKLKWVVWGGLYHQPGRWGNLPEGEVFTSPVDVNGVLKASVIGDFFSEKYGLLDTPIELVVEEGYLTSCKHPDQELVTEFWDYLSGVQNGRRVGEFAIGTNEALTELVGNLLQDEKYPGAHVAFGNPYNNYTGAVWESPIHVDVVMVEVSIWVDGDQIMEGGRFIV
jgi:leucyl aminopeptidase (aminopeptidase T)